jgi:hypothetical protein
VVWNSDQTFKKSGERATNFAREVAFLLCPLGPGDKSKLVRDASVSVVWDGPGRRIGPPDCPDERLASRNVRAMASANRFCIDMVAFVRLDCSMGGPPDQQTIPRLIIRHE